MHMKMDLSLVYKVRLNGLFLHEKWKCGYSVLREQNFALGLLQNQLCHKGQQ